jgi:hypothetical protein
MKDILDDLVTPGMVLEAGQIGRSETRHPRVRIGERAPIARHLRAAIWYRDGGRCEQAPCPVDPANEFVVHLDHIEPWSAGGADTSDNLRLLCEHHNTERSNFVDWARPKRPVTWWCHRCHDRDYQYVGDHLLSCPIHPYSGYGGVKALLCRAARLIERLEDASWFQVPPPEHFPHIAYCAHCDAPGMTGVLL